MATRYGNEGVAASGLTSPHAAGVIVIGSVLLLWAIKRGFRGVSVGGVGVGIS
jgi:hypothetical protein